MSNSQRALNILEMDKQAHIYKERFLAMLEENVALWPEDRIKRERSDAYVRWCFDTGDPEDLAKFNSLDDELNRRTVETEVLRSLVLDIKEDPVWSEHHERLFNACKERRRG